MQNSIVKFVALPILILVTSSAGAAAGSCASSSFWFRFQNETVDADIETSAEGCYVNYRSGGRTTFTNSSIASAPRNGKLSRMGSYGFNYQPRNGFHGKDGFSVKICGRGTTPAVGCSTIRYAVAVR